MKYITTPNLPHFSISGMLVDYKTPDNVINKLKQFNIEVFTTKQHPKLYNAVNGHPDMCFVHIKDDTFICEPACYGYYKHMFPMFNIVRGNTKLTDTYPYDIAYNVARVGDVAFHNLKYTDKIILEYLDKYGVKLIDVKQGYSKCSICVVDEKSIITSDRAIANQAELNNIDALLIEPGYIELAEMNYGFIGGCTGKIDKNKMVICGSLINHPDFYQISSFCNKKNVDIIELSNSTPIDVGTLIPLY